MLENIHVDEKVQRSLMIEFQKGKILHFPYILTRIFFKVSAFRG